MTTKPRQGQHKPEREGARGKELTAAKQEVKQLKRQVSRLQKTIRKMEEQRGVEIELEESAESDTPKTLENEPFKCECGSSDLVKFRPPNSSIVLTVCKSCKKRTRFAIESA